MKVYVVPTLPTGLILVTRGLFKNQNFHPTPFHGIYEDFCGFARGRGRIKKAKKQSNWGRFLITNYTYFFLDMPAHV